MPIPIVSIVPGTETPAGDGINRPNRCLVRFPDQTIRGAIVKYLEPEGVAAEVFCATLLRAWGLSVPEPAVVQAPRLAFASMDIGYPNLKQRIGWSESLPENVKRALELHGARLVAGFPETPRALAVDEAIENRDRNLGNVLWDGTNVAWIDHERALGRIPMPDLNKLVLMVQASSADQAAVQTAAVAVALTLAHQAIEQAEGDCGDHEVASFAAAVAGRMAHLATSVIQRFPQPVDLFNQQPYNLGRS